MKIFKGIFTLLIVSVFIIGCGDDEPESTNPECIDARLTTFQSDMSSCEGASVKLYLFDGQELYAFADGNCISDGGVAVVDSMCADYCFLGGIGGITECSGLDFFDNAVEQESLWSN